jgi:hypothetical protein
MANSIGAQQQPLTVTRIPAALSERKFPAGISLTAEQFADWVTHFAQRHRRSNDDTFREAIQNTILEILVTRAHERPFKSYWDFTGWLNGRIGIMEQRAEAEARGLLEVETDSNAPRTFVRHNSHPFVDHEVVEDKLDEDEEASEDKARHPRVSAVIEQNFTGAGRRATDAALGRIYGEPDYITGAAFAVDWLKHWALAELLVLSTLPEPKVLGDIAPKGSPERLVLLRRRRITKRGGLLAPLDRALDQRSAYTLGRRAALDNAFELLDDWTGRLRYLRREHADLMEALRAYEAREYAEAHRKADGEYLSEMVKESEDITIAA